VTGDRQNVVIVKRQRGCTCCGTGCVLMAAVVPASTIALWDTFGGVLALLLWPVLVVLAHVLRYTTGTQKRYPSLRRANTVGGSLRSATTLRLPDIRSPRSPRRTL